jgi:hypothetical protein
MLKLIQNLMLFFEANPDILTILGVPQNTIADIMRLEPELTNELSTKTENTVLRKFL